MNRIAVFILACFSLFMLSGCDKNEATEVPSSLISDNLNNAQSEELVKRIGQYLSDSTLQVVQDKAFIQSLRVIANDVDGLYAGVDPAASLEEQYNVIRGNMHARIDDVAASASAFYNGSKGMTILAKNSYVLMGYDALQRYEPTFWWTQLGIFAANEVRSGVVLAYVLDNVLRDMKLDVMIGDMMNMDIPATLFESTDILLQGQAEVFADIGALALMNKLHGPEIMSRQAWLTIEAQKGYAIQIDAEKALANQQIQRYKDLQTAAAIEFGAHEQIYILQKLWDKPLMVEFSKINEWMMGISKGKLSFFGAIFIGTNKYSEMMFGHTIPLPVHASDLTNGVARVEIARNGFNTLNKLRKQPYWESWVKKSQSKLGHQQGVYHARNLDI